MLFFHFRKLHVIDHESTHRDEEKERLFKQVASNLIKLFMLLTALGAVKTSGATQKLIIEALLIALVVFFLVLLLHTMLQDHISTTFFAILFIIVLAGVVSVLTLSLTSWTAAFVTLGLWVFTIIVLLFFNSQELILSAVSERVKKLMESYMPQRRVPTIIQKWISACWPQRSDPSPRRAEMV